jgi:hypothetical protein
VTPLLNVARGLVSGGRDVTFATSSARHADEIIAERTVRIHRG